jgi:fumarylpyruvate hydrolase
MPDTLFTLPDPVSIPVNGETAAYPVGRIFCVGRNYAAHAAEMGVEVDREAPFYFTKAASHAQASDTTLPYPPGTENFHYEMELAVAIGKPVFQADLSKAAAAIYAYGCALDMTRRDLQQALRAKQRPWDLGKDVEGCAVFAPLSKAATIGTIGPQKIRLSVNGKQRQNATLTDMVWSVPELVRHLSGYYHLRPGDLILTGTPAGVGPVVAGDIITGSIDGLDPIRLSIS